MTDLDRLRTLTYGTAFAAAVADGALVGGWIATRGVDETGRRRRRRFLLAAGIGAQAFSGDLVWRSATGHRVRAVQADSRADVQHALLGTASSLVLAVVDRRLPHALARRGVRRPHHVAGTAVGVGYAACALPVHWSRARGRMAALELVTLEDAT